MSQEIDKKSTSEVSYSLPPPATFRLHQTRRRRHHTLHRLRLSRPPALKRCPPHPPRCCRRRLPLHFLYCSIHAVTIKSRNNESQASSPGFICLCSMPRLLFNLHQLPLKFLLGNDKQLVDLGAIVVDSTNAVVEEFGNLGTIVDTQSN